MNSQLQLSNQQARKLWLHCQCLLNAPLSGSQHHLISDTISALGMVQLDSIGVLARAHDHILWSRHSSYRKADFYRLSSETRDVFEHFSHDAVILPMSTYPYWQRQFKRKAELYKNSVWGKQIACAKTQAWILREIENNGPMCSQNFTRRSQQKADKTLHAWMRSPCKLALDYLWLTGQLSVSHREGFIKFYDLTPRVIPSRMLKRKISDREQINWLCSNALRKLGFGTAAQIQRFFDACSLDEVKRWLADNSQQIQTIEVESHCGDTSAAFAFKDLEAVLERLPDASGRVRIVNPFDPVVRDRARLTQLFGFDYRIEIYVPAAKRRYGYYVFPVLEGDKFIGRIDTRADRQKECLKVRAWWVEHGIKPGSGRANRLESELNRLARFVQVKNVEQLPEPLEELASV